MKLKIAFIFIFSITAYVKSYAFDVLNRIDYVKTYNSYAIENMKTYKIPASITLAQGILESGSGKSELARISNNHFGIKCGSNWNGLKTYHDDDAEKECFRVYKNAIDSYHDHSKFLTENRRYSDLFTLRLDDYKSWARGLSLAGYATNPNYANSLIQIIEELNLNLYDEFSPPSKSITHYTSHTSNLVYLVNDVKIIKASKGDSYYKISKKYGLTLRQIHNYNDTKYKSQDILTAGEIVYLEPKRMSSRKNKFIVLDKNTNLIEISTKEGVKLNSLVRKNHNSSPDEQLRKGEKVFLR